MRKLALLFGIFGIFLTILFMHIPAAYAEHVNGYFRSNGTYVQGYERTSPDSSPYDNYDYPGNYNPNTGNITGGSQTSYLNNYYKTSIASNPILDGITPQNPNVNGYTNFAKGSIDFILGLFSILGLFFLVSYLFGLLFIGVILVIKYISN